MIIFAKGWSIAKDGPGQRLVYYLKGCNLRCRWCAAPESISPVPEVMFYPERSNEDISYVCPFQAISLTSRDLRKCVVCESKPCVTKWRNPCFEVVGTTMSPDKILHQAVQVRDMFGENGGVTFGGGEATLQAEELLETMKLLRQNYIHTTLETNATSAQMKQIAEAVDLLICDFKAFSRDAHQSMTGADNARIIKNLSFAIANKRALIIRIPLIPGLNDSESEMDLMAEFLANAAKMRSEPLDVEILRMHHIGRPKYKALGLQYPMENIKEPPYELAEKFLEKLKNAKLKTVIGG